MFIGQVGERAFFTLEHLFKTVP